MSAKNKLMKIEEAIITNCKYQISFQATEKERDSTPGFLTTVFKSSHQRCSIKKAVLKNFAIFTRKRLYWSLSLIKLQAAR